MMEIGYLYDKVISFSSQTLYISRLRILTLKINTFYIRSLTTKLDWVLTFILSRVTRNWETWINLHFWSWKDPLNDWRKVEKGHTFLDFIHALTSVPKEQMNYTFYETVLAKWLRNNFEAFILFPFPYTVSKV